MKKVFVIIMAATAILAGCKHQELTISEGEGSLQVNAVTCEGDYIQVTKAAEVADFNIVIYRTHDQQIVKECKYSDIQGQIVKFGSGDYRICVSSPSQEDAAWNQPIYYGEQTFKILAGQVTPVTVSCSISNMKVSITLSDNFKKELTRYDVAVSNGKGALVWEKGENRNDFEENKAGYFTVGVLTVTVSGYRAIDGTTATSSFTIAEVAPRQHHIINIDAKVTGEANIVSLDIDDTVTPVDQDFYVDGLEEIPVEGPDDEEEQGGDEGGDEGDDPVSSTAPTMTWAANPTFQPVDIVDGMNVELVITAPEKIKSFTILVESEVLSSTIAALSKDAATYQEGNPSTMDMINDETLIENLNGMGLGIPTGDAIKGQTSVNFSLSNLIPLIKMYGAAPGMEHNFTLTVEDEKGQKLVKTLVFVSVAE